MSDVSLHRLYRHYSELPYSQRVLYTATLIVLGLGYLFADRWEVLGDLAGSLSWLLVGLLVLVAGGVLAYRHRRVRVAHEPVDMPTR